MPAVHLHDTLTGSDRPIQPLAGTGGRVTFYSCGPTVYDDAHIGNFRSFLNADVLRRTLELVGLPVRHVMNITDVGHMTDDAQADGGGEDKMAVAGRRLAEAKKSGTLPAGAEIDPADPLAIANFYADRFLEDARLLGLKVAEEQQRDPALMPRPTAWIPQMIDMVRRLIERGHAYVAGDGVVYFDVRSFGDYGQLSGNTLEALREGEGGRVSAANQAAKRHPADFMLWKPDPTHLMKWDSPWGAGYPGWHLECSAMAAGLLGDQIDLHSGGEDNIFPHHECEIAQSRCCHGTPAFARHWFHTRHLMVEGQKMSKSKGNFFTARDLFAKGVTPAALRLELVRTHYRVNANFTLQGLADCQRMIDRWARHTEALEDSVRDLKSEAGATRAARHAAAAAGPMETALQAFTQALCDDLNVARAIASLNEALGQDHSSACPARELASLRRMDLVLGVLDRNRPVASEAAVDLESKVAELLARRAEARAAKDWASSDRVRDELTALGVQIKDGPTGTTWSRVVR
jgi:cysteinyl-tRNA synthetase